MDDYDDILGIEENNDDGYKFEFRSIFKIIDNNRLKVKFHKLFKRSLKKNEKEINIITINPIDINDIGGLELSEFKINKLYDGEFIINYYSNKKYDIFLKKYK